MTKARSNATANAAKGDLTVGNGTNLSGVLGVGSNGDTIVADSSTSTGLRWQGDYAAGKNKFFNGDFGIWQRGTSATGTAKYFAADRWSTDSTATCTTSRQTFTVGQTDVPGNPTYFMQVAFTTVTASVSVTSQYIEDVGTLAGRTATVSFYAKISSGTASLDAQYVQRFGSGGSSAVAASFGTVNLTTAWQRFIFTVAIPSISGKTVGSGNALQIRLIGTTAAVNYDFSNFQIEEGSVATAFQTATGTIQGELAACQRYYFRNTVGSGVLLSTVGTASGSTNSVTLIQPPVPMRVTPTSLDFATVNVLDTVSAYSLSNLVIASSSNPAYVQLTGTTTGLTALRPCFLAGSAANSFIGLSAEL